MWRDKAAWSDCLGEDFGAGLDQAEGSGRGTAQTANLSNAYMRGTRSSSTMLLATAYPFAAKTRATRTHKNHNTPLLVGCEHPFLHGLVDRPAPSAYAPIARH